MISRRQRQELRSLKEQYLQRKQSLHNSVAAGLISIELADGEGVTKTISVTADSIGDTQLAYNTGQHLTTSSNTQ